MYTKEEASALKQAFWTVFGQYMALSLSAEGEKINWINYKTGIKHLHFKMQADNHVATMTIEMSHPELGIQELMFEQFKAFQNLLKSNLNEDWEWELHTPDANYKIISKISICLTEVSIFKKADWPAMISFLKPRIIALDAFWTDAQYSFSLFK
ncbi:hypothetical protein AAKU52_001230 [Pedobacter sp. CG_S7]|uniref:DUF4268 domain-containing protein n=1 Tax=Pedobacter sp. CG_S7 TaxID=3143930 RepID=UPI003395A522